MEKTSGLLSLLALTQYGLEDMQDDMTLRIIANIRYYKDLHITPLYIKGDQLQKITVRL
jgi:hypothetical protein